MRVRPTIVFAVVRLRRPRFYYIIGVILILGGLALAYVTPRFYSGTSLGILGILASPMILMGSFLILGAYEMQRRQPKN